MLICCEYKETWACLAVPLILRYSVCEFLEMSFGKLGNEYLLCICLIVEDVEGLIQRRTLRYSS